MSDAVHLPLLQQVRIASPCPVRWDEMTGGEVTRRCAQCDLDVHNLSAMTADEAERFLRARLGDGARLCAQIWRRQDGTIITRDCPVGLALWRRRAGWAAGRIAAALLFVLTGGWALSNARRDLAAQRLRSTEPFRTLCEWVNPSPPPVPQLIVTGGVVCPSPAEMKEIFATIRAETLAEARRLRDSGRPDEALSTVESLLAREPDCAEAAALKAELDRSGTPR